MAIEIRKAQRKKAKLRLALIGPTGSGKTYSALKMAFGLGGKIGLIDTEHGSGDLYADMGDYDVITLEPPFTVPKYREAIFAFERAGYGVIIVDSLTHAWAGEGGLLDKQGQLEKDTAKYKNAWSTWREITPEHNKLVEELIGSPAHIIATLRVKTEYVLEKNEKGKLEPRKVGLAPVFRDGIEYEFTVCMDVSAEHVAHASKDRTRLFDGWYDRISEETGIKLLNWLESGVETPSAPPPEPPEDKARAGAELLASRFVAASSEIALTALSADKTIIIQRAWLRENRPDLSAPLEETIAAALERVSPPDDALGMPEASEAA